MIAAFVAWRNGTPAPAPAAPAATPVEQAPGEAALAAKEALKTDPKYSKYAKMCAVGVPLGAVRDKMVTEGLSEEDVAVFMKAFTSSGTLEGML